MEFALLIIVIAVMGCILSVTNGNTRKRCDELGVRHEWVTKGSGDDTYLVCEKCKTLLSGLSEETDRGNYDF